MRFSDVKSVPKGVHGKVSMSDRGQIQCTFVISVFGSETRQPIRASMKETDHVLDGLSHFASFLKVSPIQLSLDCLGSDRNQTAPSLEKIKDAIAAQS
jgi:hypothetical protein